MYEQQQQGTVTAMEYTVSTKSNRSKKFIECLMPSMIKQLGLENSRKYVLIDVSKAGPGESNDGITVPLPGLDCYVIAIKLGPPDKMGATLAHEMVHIKQMAKGQLKSVGKNQYWAGKKYTSKTKYLYLPWEVEAFSKQELIFRRAVEDS